MNAVIASFRQGRSTQTDNQMVIHVEGVDNREKAKALVGKQVIWTTPGKKELKGKISALHGNHGRVRAIFETGMPGQSLGTTIKIA